MNTPVMDERPSVLGFSSISDFEDTDQPSLPEMFVATSEMRILDRLNNLETIIREQHLKTRDHVTQGFRECMTYEKSLISKLYKDLGDVSTQIQGLQARHQVDPGMVNSILGLVNQTILYLHHAALLPATTSPQTGSTAQVSNHQPALGQATAGNPGDSSNATQESN